MKKLTLTALHNISRIIRTSLTRSKEKPKDDTRRFDNSHYEGSRNTVEVAPPIGDVLSPSLDRLGGLDTGAASLPKCRYIPGPEMCGPPPIWCIK